MIHGRKKGGGRAPTEAADTLRSTQIAEVALLVSEGECEGLVNGLKSVFLDGVRVENADGSRNFENVEFAYTVGTQGQAALPGLGAVQAEVAVGVQVDQATPVTRTITDPATDHVRVTIGVPQLTEQNATTGDLNGSTFEFTIEVQSNGGGFVEKHRATVKGKTTSRYSRAVRLALTGSAPWDVRVKRISADPAAANIVNRFSWDSYTTIRTAKLRYPNSAVAFLRVNAQNFGRVPVVSLDWLGLRMKVPVNYDPITRTTSGAWNGTFKNAWTDNPAWVFYLLATHERFGLGRYLPASLPNKWALYQIAQYCDGMVDDGRGGVEPRFSINAYIQTRREAYALLQDLAAVFRGMSYWAAGTVDFAQDAPGEAELLYAPANVVGGDFTYADTGERQQHSVFIVQWADLSQFGKLVPEVYADRELVARYGVRELTLQAFGCTSRGQAARTARWAAYTERYEGEVVTFKVGADGEVARPGRLFKVADPTESGERMGGRIRTATAAQVTLDADVTLAPGEAYSLSVLQPSDDPKVGFVAEKRTVTTAAGTAGVLTVSPPFSAVPTPDTVWLLESNALEPTWWRCLQAEEVQGEQEWPVTGVRHFPGKYALIEQGLKLDTPAVSRLTLRPPKPASVAITETPYLTGSVTRSRVMVSWPEPARGLNYLVSWRLSNGPWNDMPATSGNSADVDGLARGVFEVSVRSINAFGNGSPPATQTRVLLGKTARPVNVSGLAVTLIQGAVLAVWNANTEADYLTTEVRVGASWEAGATIFEGAASRFNWAWPAQGAYTLWFRHFDTSLNESLAAVSAAVTVSQDIYTQWQDLRGDGLPADNATSDLALVARGVTVSGNSAWKNAGPGADWDADCYSVDSYTGGAFASAVPAQTNGGVMVGLNTDPTFNASYASIDFAVYCEFGGQLWAYESGAGHLIGTYAANDVLAVLYDGSQVRYLRNGAVLRTAAATITAPLYLDTSFATPGVRLDKLRFGPMTSNAWGAIGGRPADAQILKNLLNPAAWVPGSSGSQPGFTQNPTSAGGENFIAYDTRPDGSVGPIWRARSGGAAGDSPEGGWNTGLVKIDHTRMYRFRVWVRVFGGNGSGFFYLGCSEVNEVGGGLNTNPYFVSNSRSALPADQWALVVGYVYPSTYAGGPQGKGGVWRAQDGFKLLGGTDFRWADGQTTSFHRAYQYYTNVADNYTDFDDPRIELCDGSETPVDQLLAGAAARNAGTALTNAATAQGAANTANALHADMSSDAKLTAVEKQTARIHWDAIQDEKPGIDARADALGITTEKAAYGAAYSALSAYVTPLLASLATTSDIVGADYRWAFANLYATRQALLNKVSEEAAKRAEWGGVSGVSVTTEQLGLESTVKVITPTVVSTHAIGQMPAGSSGPAIVAAIPALAVDCRISVRVMFHVALSNGASNPHRVGAYLYFEPPPGGGPPGGSTERFPPANSLPCQPDAALNSVTVGTNVLTHTFTYTAGSGARQVALVLGRVGVTPSAATADGKDITMTVEVLKR